MQTRYSLDCNLKVIYRLKESLENVIYEQKAVWNKKSSADPQIKGKCFVAFRFLLIYMQVTFSFYFTRPVLLNCIMVIINGYIVKTGFCYIPLKNSEFFSRQLTWLNSKLLLSLCVRACVRVQGEGGWTAEISTQLFQLYLGYLKFVPCT